MFLMDNLWKIFEAVWARAAEPTSYYTSKYTGEEMDALLDKVAAQSG